MQPVTDAHQPPRRRQRGFTLIELLIVVAIIGILAAIAIPVYTSLEQRARIARARADLRTIASAVSMYDAHMSGLPPALDDLTSPVTNAQNQVAGPFLGVVPMRPNATWTHYSAGYSIDTATGMFTVSATGDGATISLP